MRSVIISKWAKIFLFLLCLVPAGQLLVKALRQELGANPIEFVTHFTGDYILIFLVATLSITPARKVLHWPELIRFRRMIGLFAFFYACLHFLTWSVLDKFFDYADMWKDVIKRPFILAGFTAFTLMIPLAITSTSGWIRRLGKHWRTLHRLIYFSAIAGVIHYYWLVKSDVRKPLQYMAMVSVLLFARMAIWAQKKMATRAVLQTNR